MARKIKKTSKGNVIMAILIIAVVVALGVGVVAATHRFTGLLNNNDNLVHTLEEYVSKGGNSGNGLVWTVNDDGSIHCEGTITDDDLDEATFVIGTVTVTEEDFYTLSGAPKGSKNTFYIKAEYEDESGNLKTFYSDFDGECTSETKLDKDTEVTLTIVVKSGVEIDYTFEPTLVAGEVAGKF